MNYTFAWPRKRCQIHKSKLSHLLLFIRKGGGAWGLAGIWILLVRKISTRNECLYKKSWTYTENTMAKLKEYTGISPLIHLHYEVAKRVFFFIIRKISKNFYLLIVYLAMLPALGTTMQALLHIPKFKISYSVSGELLEWCVKWFYRLSVNLNVFLT